MEDATAARYWCHMCSQMVDPIVEVEVEIKCPYCQSGFIEEMIGDDSHRTADSDFGSDRAFSLWAPILLGMMGNPRRRRRFRRTSIEDDDDDDDGDDRDRVRDQDRETVLDREPEAMIRRRRRSSAAILQLLHGIRAGLASESSQNSESNTNSDRERDRERVILINPFNQTIVVQGSYDSSRDHHVPIGSLGDYVIGPGLDLLLQHLAENDSNRYGTPPARKEVIEALPTVKINENLQCSVCLDDFEMGAEAKEMPCKHKFHSGCILPWLELHSSCPVCRFQLPADESKRDSDRPRSISQGENEGGSASVEEGDGDGDIIANGTRFSFPWPFNGLFPSSGGNASFAPTSPSSSSNSNANAGGDASQSDDN